VSLRHPLLEARGVAHAFGIRGAAPPDGLRRPRQVHGIDVVDAEDCDPGAPPEADAVVSSLPGVPVAVVTADCVPLLLAGDEGRAVAAIHAGWRGLAAGVIEAGVAALRRRSESIVAVVGPHIGSCCYEVDTPVLDALRRHHGEAAVGAASRAERPGHAQLDLGALAERSLLATGLSAGSIGRIEGACTRCDAERFHSYRRDGPRAGRLVHYVTARLA
jgi:YfiH family protein